MFPSFCSFKKQSQYPAQGPTNPRDRSHRPLAGAQLKPEQSSVWTAPTQESLARIQT